MRARSLILSVLFLGIAGVVNVRSAQPSNPEASRQRYDSIVTNLDTGGDIMVVVNMDGLVQELVNTITGFIQFVPESEPSRSTLKTAVYRLPAFLDKNGFYAVQGFGMSVVPRADGLNALKTFVARDPAAADLPLWRGLVGGPPRNLNATEFCPLIRSWPGPAAAT